jgi:hypothetical protein
MFIDERNQLQFESIEELSANKEFAIKEIIDSGIFVDYNFKLELKEN